MMRFNEAILSYYLRLSNNDIFYAQDIMIQLKFKFIFWIRFEVLFKANIKDTFQGEFLG
jgi:hypothetical protein